jgi:hypothetical protein
MVWGSLSNTVHVMRIATGEIEDVIMDVYL